VVLPPSADAPAAPTEPRTGEPATVDASSPTVADVPGAQAGAITAAPGHAEDSATGLGLADAQAPYRPTVAVNASVSSPQRGAHAPFEAQARSFYDLDQGIATNEYLLRIAFASPIDGFLSASPEFRLSQRAGPAQGGEGTTNDDNPPSTIIAEVAQATGVALTLGTVWWALRAGGLLASLGGALPAWRHVDLLAILPDDEDVDGWDRDADDEGLRDDEAVGGVFDAASDGDKT
jgi:hypothetical protein